MSFARLCALLLSMTAASCPGLAAATETTTYTYDALGRLTGTAVAGSVNNGQSSITSFDASNNRTCLSSSISTSAAPVFSICDAWVTEGGTFNFVVTRKGDSTTSVGVHWATTAGSATAGTSGTTGTDYLTGSGDLAFAANERTKLIAVTTFLDSVTEVNETLTVTLSLPTGTSPSGNAALGDATATGWIMNDD